MGWTKGLGADLALRIEDIVEPTDVLEMESTAFSTDLLVRMQDNLMVHGRKAHMLEPIATELLSANYSPADYRTLSILSYFHAVFPPSDPRRLQQACAISWNTVLPLCARIPYEVDWTVAFQKVILIGSGMEDVVPSEIERVLNSAVVGLVRCDPGTVDVDIQMPPLEKDGITPKIPYIQGSSPPSPSTSVCCGLALIRAISPTSPHMHVVTPLPPDVFAESRVLVKGDLELPIWGMLDFRADSEAKGCIAGVETGRVPFLKWGKKQGLGTERRRVRRNLMRKGQM
jgi:polynucleotide 5'-hydroxyl-kinase GRC3/NOL9